MNTNKNYGDFSNTLHDYVRKAHERDISYLEELRFNFAKNVTPMENRKQIRSVRCPMQITTTARRL